MKKIFFIIFSIIIIFALLGIFDYLNKRISVQVPTQGGTISEGILGTPRFINPILTQSDIDRDMTMLVYSGLTRKTTINGVSSIIPDLAESFTISDDKKEYTFILREKIFFHDRKPVTADDVIFTIKTIQDNQFKSSLANDWSGVSVTSPDEKTIIITLPRPYSGFPEIASVGILPKHIWGKFSAEEFIASDANVLPIGSGPYKIASIKRSAIGTATQYTLHSFNQFKPKKPFIDKIIIKLYPNEQELFSGYESKKFNLLANIRPHEITDRNTLQKTTALLPRMFGLFINQKNQILNDASIKQALINIVDSSEIVSNVFQGYAKSLENKTTERDPNIILETAGWKINNETGIREKAGVPLSFSISTADTPELKYSAQIIQKQLKSIGADVEVKIFQLNDLETQVINTQSFDMLLFGQSVKTDADRYAFWHSSQKNVPGLNITNYTNKSIDELLEKLLVTDYFSPERQEIINSLQTKILDTPVIWLYQPLFIYTANTAIGNKELVMITDRKDRFSDIYHWYVKTDTVWKWFAQNK